MTAKFRALKLPTLSTVPRATVSLATVSLASLMLASCGGGGSTNRSTPPPTVVTPPPPVATGPTWTQGVFEPESRFVARCENPRSGTDPSTITNQNPNGSPFADREGSFLEEKFWQRSWSNRTYLWYDEITDIDPITAIDPETQLVYDRLGYFGQLKTMEKTASGADKDRFHFTQDTAARFERVSTGASAGYGGQYAFLETRPPRDVRIAFTEADSPFAEANVQRGAKILEIDGVDAVNGGTQADVDTLNAALFPSELGETHTFVFEDSPGAEPRTVTVTSATVISDPVLSSSVIEEGDDKVGYVVFNTFGTSTAERRLFETFTDLAEADVDDLVLDLRYNGGGFLDIASQLGYMIAGDKSEGQTFETLQFNDKFPTRNPVTNELIRPTPFFSETLGFSLNAGTDLPTLDLDRVFILSTSGTCSASEAVINSLRGIDVEVILVGDTTCGKPFGFYTTDNCGVSYSTIQFQGVNAKGFGDFGDGFSPGTTGMTVSGELVQGCVIPDDYSAQLGDTEEAMLQGALTFQSTGECPIQSTAQAKGIPDSQQRSFGDAAGLSITDSPIYQLEMSYRETMIRDTPPSIIGQGAN